MPQSVQMVACHYANRSGRGKAAFFLSLEAAREMVEAGLAAWSRGAKYLNLMRTESEMPPTPQSLLMGPPVMLAAACGDARAMAMRDAWA